MYRRRTRRSPLIALGLVLTFRRRKLIPRSRPFQNVESRELSVLVVPVGLTLPELKHHEQGLMTSFDSV